MKGQGTTMKSIILVFIMLVLFIIVMVTVFFSGQRQFFLNLKEAEILKTKNEFYLQNRSLGMTWFVSAVQTVFRAADESVNSNDAYWYRTNPKLAAEQRLPQADQCSTRNPRICLPQNPHVSAYLLGFMQSYLSVVSSDFDAGSVKLRVSNIKLDARPRNFWPAYDRVTALVVQDMVSRLSDTKVVATTRSDNAIFTEFRKMVGAGWRVVSLATAFRQEVDKDMHNYPDSTGDRNTNYNYVTYLEEKETYLDGKTKEIADWLRPSVVSQFTVGEMNAYVGTANEDGILLPKTGLIFFYDLRAVFSEGFAAAPAPGQPAPVPAPPGTPPGGCASLSYSSEITNAITGKGAWSFGYVGPVCPPWLSCVTFTNEEIKTTVASIIQQESNWDPNALSFAGAVGLMQIHPPSHPQCGTAEQLREPARNINCGVNFLYDLFNKYSTKGDKENVQRLAIAAYNGGAATIDEALRIARSRSLPETWESINNRDIMLEAVRKFGLGDRKADEIMAYVPGVARCFSYYGAAQPPFAITFVGGATAGQNYVDARRESDHDIDTLVMHTCEGSYQNCINEVRSSRERKGAHYVVSRSGEIAQVVLDEDVAFHAGDLSTNQRSIGIEHEGFSGRSDTWTPQMMQASAQLSAWLAAKYRIPADRAHVIGHSEVPGCPSGTGGGSSCHTDPGRYFDWEQYLRLMGSPALPVPAAPRVPGLSLALPASVSSPPYYYHDEPGNRFGKRPFTLPVSAKDYLIPLNCADHPAGMQFSWLTEKDFICKDGEVHSCDRDMQGLEAANKKSHQSELGTKPDRYQCITSGCAELPCSPTFCREHDDGINARDELGEQCCEQWAWRDGLQQPTWLGKTVLRGRTERDDACAGRAYCFGDWHADKDRGEVCDYRKRCDPDTITKDEAGEAGCSFYCDGPGHKWDCNLDTASTCAVDARSDAAVNSAYTGRSCQYDCGPGKRTYDSHGEFCISEPDCIANYRKCFSESGCVAAMPLCGGALVGDTKKIQCPTNCRVECEPLNPTICLNVCDSYEKEVACSCSGWGGC